MTPITLISTALATGAAPVIKGVACQAIKDAYNGLKALVQQKFSGQPDAELVLAKYEEKPEVWETPLKDALAEVDADGNDEMIEAAEKLMEVVNSQQAATGKYNTQITGNIHGFVQGDSAQVEMNFGNLP